MRRAIPILLTLPALLCACASSHSTTTEAATGVMNFADTTHGIRFTYPGDWSEKNFLKPRNAIVVLEIPSPGASSGTLPPTFSLVAQEASQAASSSDLAAMEQRMIDKAMREVGEFQLIETSDTTLAGEPARRVIYAGKKLGVRLQVMNVLTTHAGRGYAGAFMCDPESFDEFRPAVDKVVASVEFTR